MGRQQKAARSRNRRGSIPGDTRQGHDTGKRRAASGENQRQRLIAYLRERGSISTLEARALNPCIMAPAARIFELKQEGVEILTIEDKQQGCGRYFLLNEGGADVCKG